MPAATEPRLTYLQRLTPAERSAIARKGGQVTAERQRAKRGLMPTKKIDEAQAFELVKESWTEHAQDLVEQARKAAHDDKKDGRSVVALTTAAAIAFDKRWAKQVSDNTEISLPHSLIAPIVAKLAQSNQQVAADVPLLSRECDIPKMTVDEAIEALRGIGPDPEAGGRLAVG